MIRILTSFLLLAAALPVNGAPIQVRLPDEPGRLPYRFVEYPVKIVPLRFDERWGCGTLLRDLDGDGYDEHFVAGKPGIVRYDLNPEGGMGTVWWRNAPVEYVWRRPCAALNGIWDCSGAGVPELVLTLHTEDRFRWRIERRRADDGELVAAYDLPGGKDKRADGQWDGFYGVIGCIDSRLPDGVRRVLLVGASAGHDEQPRGVFALDTATGERVWEYFVGPKVEPEQIHVLDLDADGRQEICFMGAGVNNLDGAEINGTSDDRAGLFVLNDDGTLAWSYHSDPGTVGLSYDVADAGGDGEFELYVGENLERSNDNQFLVFDSWGEILARWETGNRLNYVHAHERPDGSVRIVGALSRTQLALFTYDGGELSPGKILEFSKESIKVGAVADIVPEPGLEFLIGNSRDRMWLLSEDGEPLAHGISPRTPLRPGCGMIWQPAGELPTILLETYTEDERSSFRLATSPRPFPIVPVGAAGALLAGAGTLLWRRKNRPAPATIREHRIQLLGRLKLASHGKIGALSTLRRLIWLHETRSQGFALKDEPRDIYPVLGEEIRGEGVRDLAGALKLAELAELDRERIAATRRALERLREMLDRLAAARYDERALAGIADDLGEAAAAAEAAFQHLRRDVERSFQADPEAILRRSLVAHAETIRTGGVQIELPDTAAPPCRIDAEEMTFVLDNLVENALRSMVGDTVERSAESPQPRLGIEWSVEEGEVTILVSDTGCGIIPDDWSRIFEPGFSKRKGGGMGLPRSREILRKYGGALFVRESSPGNGTTFQLRCPALED